MKIKFIALFLCVVMILPMVFACGDSSDSNSGSANNNAANNDQANAGEETITEPPPTEPPTTTEAPPTEPPTTEEPTEPFVVDPSMTYWDQIAAEIAHYGFTGGTKISSGDTEEAALNKFTRRYCKREEIDISGDGVPFSDAFRLVVDDDKSGIWDVFIEAPMLARIPVPQDDIIVGAIWVKGKSHEKENTPAEFELIFRSQTDWQSLESEHPYLIKAGDEWQKVFFSGRVGRDDESSQRIYFSVCLGGYGLQEVDLGGYIAYIYPSTTENEKALSRLFR